MQLNFEKFNPNDINNIFQKKQRCYIVTTQKQVFEVMVDQQTKYFRNEFVFYEPVTQSSIPLEAVTHINTSGFAAVDEPMEFVNPETNPL